MGKKKSAERSVLKTSVRSYEEGVCVEKQRMGDYTKKMASSVKSLQGEFKRHSKEIKEAGKTMNVEGKKKMNAKVEKFTGEMKTASKQIASGVRKLNNDIKDQVQENKEAVSRIGGSIKLLLSEVNKKKKDFQAYARGPFNGYIKAFWG